MTPRPPLPGGPYLVVGLARSGVAAALALRERGEEVMAVDAGTPDVGRLRAAGVEVTTDAAGENLVPRARTLVKSPGVPSEASVVRAARAAGLTVLGELELGWRMLTNPFIAVTGTNGKTTTSELVGAMLRAGGREVAVAGNVGRALTTLPGEVAPGAWVVAEASSFQLEDTEAFRPEGAVLLNLSPDHEDRHGSFEAYTAAKLRIFAQQRPEDIAVIPASLALDVPGRTVTFGPRGDLEERDGALWHGDERLIDVAEIRLPGPHNRLNALAAAGVTLALGLEPGAVREALATFAGVPHRLEPVATHDGVLYVNDSKATNVASTLVALGAFDDLPIRLILGGRGKGQNFSPLRAAVARRCAGVHLIGEDAEAIAAGLAGVHVPLSRDGDLAAAVAAARAAAEPGDVVLLSPACASFDQFTDFEARGDAFRGLVA